MTRKKSMYKVAVYGLKGHVWIVTQCAGITEILTAANEAAGSGKAVEV